jgi:hypothetical protein
VAKVVSPDRGPTEDQFMAHRQTKQQKQEFNSQVRSTSMQHFGTTKDKLILSRLLGCPGILGSEQWTLSSECFICERWCYSVIFASNLDELEGTTVTSLSKKLATAHGREPDLKLEHVIFKLKKSNLEYLALQTELKQLHPDSTHYKQRQSQLNAFFHDIHEDKKWFKWFKTSFLAYSNFG